MRKKAKQQKTRFREAVSRNEKAAGWIFILPATVCWLIWFLYPFLQCVGMSFLDYNYLKPKARAFVGLDNYIHMFQDPKFLLALKNTLWFVVVTVPVVTVLALALALILNSSFRGRGVFRTISFIPYTISGVAVATVFMHLFVKDSAVTVFFSRLGVENVTWYASIHLVMPFISILFIWQMVGFYTVYYLAGIQTIPAQVYEAAVIDGAGKWKTFRYITLPLLKPTTYLVIVYAIIQAFKVYDQIAAICGGAGGGLGSPAGASSTLLTYFYMNSFNYYKVGYGCAVAIVLLLIIVAVNLIQNRITDSGDQD